MPSYEETEEPAPAGRPGPVSGVRMGAAPAAGVRMGAAPAVPPAAVVVADDHAVGAVAP